MTKPALRGDSRSAPNRRRASVALRVLTGLGLATLLFGCGELNVRRDLGLVEKGPDEFSVIKKKPLQMPTNSASLPEPRPGARSLVEPDPAADARAALLGERAVTPQAPTAQGASESALVKAAGAGSADPAIRATLEDEAEDLAEGGRLLDVWFGRNKPNEQPLDAAEEARRLAEQAQAGKNPNLILLPEPEKKK